MENIKLIDIKTKEPIKIDNIYECCDEHYIITFHINPNKKNRIAFYDGDDYITKQEFKKCSCKFDTIPINVRLFKNLL